MDSFTRHELRNRFASIRNAAFYLKTRVEKRTDLFHTDSRVAAFFALIDEELKKAEGLLAEGSASGQVPGQAADHASSARRRVLLVDDDERVTVTLSALLEEEGFSLDTARSLADARALLGGEAAYDVVLLDINLRDGSGLDLLPGIRTRLPGAVVLGIGAALEPGTAAGSFDDIVPKEGAFVAALGLLRG